MRGFGCLVYFYDESEIASHGNIAGIASQTEIRHQSTMTEIATVVCPHVFCSERPVALLAHYVDGTWQAVCGQRDHSTDCHDFQVVGLNHLLDRQADLEELTSLLPDWFAEKISGQWVIAQMDESELG